MSTIDVRSINLNLLPALEALLAERSVSVAARRLGVTQSAMSHTLARLRELLGDPLLVSAGRGFVLTPAAARLAVALPPALSQLGRALAPPEAFDPRTSTRAFRVATLDSFELTTLPAALEHLREHAPSVTLELQRFAPASLAAVAAGEVDLALVGRSMTAPIAGLSQRTLFREPFAVIAREGHPRVRRSLSLEAYCALGHVLVSVEGRRLGVVDRALAAVGRARSVALRVAHFVSAPIAVASSDLLCTLPKSVAEASARRFGVRVFAPPLPLPETPIVALWSRSLDGDAANRWLRGLFGDRSALGRAVPHGTTASKRARKP